MPQFFIFFLCSQHVSIKFPRVFPIATRFKSVSIFYLLSQCVPNGFPSSSQSVLQDVPEALHFYMVWFASSWTFLCILYINSLVCLSMCLFDSVHSDSLTISAKLILQPPDDRNEVPKWAAPGLKCSSARCGSWWRRDTHLLDPLSPHTSHRSRY